MVAENLYFSSAFAAEQLEMLGCLIGELREEMRIIKKEFYAFFPRK